MNGSELRPDLRDIHLPDASLWWPPAPGWWVALVLLLILMVVVPWVIRRIRQTPLKRLGLHELDRIRQNLAGGQSERAVVADAAALLRRTVIACQGRAGFADSTGDTWMRQLQQLAVGQRFSQSQLEILGRDRYRRNFECDVDGLLQACEHWIRALPRSEPHVSD